jgi:hypothetical protein
VVLHEYDWRGLFVTRHELGKGVGCLIVTLEDVMMFKNIELLKLSYLMMVYQHVGVLAIRLPHDLVDNKLTVVDVNPLDPELGGDAQAVDEGLILCHVVCHIDLPSTTPPPTQLRVKEPLKYVL